MEHNDDKYWVVGGVYTDTDFKHIASGYKMEEYGPYDTYEEAEDKWRGLAWKTVDICQQRYEIKVGIWLDLPQDTLDYLERTAKENNQTFNQFLEDILRKAIEAEEEKYPFTKQDFLDISE